uniref:Uncharacterized protein n=1 Tax=Anguilla anguilla TaxID=7936 RepID=A0A0E9PCQ0_ANGAN
MLNSVLREPLKETKQKKMVAKAFMIL